MVPKLLILKVGLSFLVASSLLISSAPQSAFCAVTVDQAAREDLSAVNKLIAQRSFNKAQIMINRLLSIKPDDFSVLLAQGRLLESMGLVARSRAAYEKLQQAYPQAPEPLIALSEIAFESLNARLAFELASKAVAIAPNSLAAHLSLASALIATSQYPQGEILLHELNKQHPNNSEIQYMLYRMALKRNHYKEARDCLEQSIRFDNTDYRRKLELAEVDKNLRDYASARQNLEQFLLVEPSSTEALTKLAVLWEFNFHNYAKAVDMYQSVLNVDPDSVTALAGIDRCRLKSNDLAGLMKDAFVKTFRHTDTFDAFDAFDAFDGANANTPNVSDGRDFSF